MVEYWYDDKEVKTITDDRKLRSYTRSKKKGSAVEEYWEINLVRSENFPKN